MIFNNRALAELKVTTYRRRFGALTYDELIMLAEDADKTADQLGPFDPAFKYFAELRHSYFKFAEALNDKDDLSETRHLYRLNTLVSFKRGSLTFEMAAKIPRYAKAQFLQLSQVQAYIHHQLRREQYSLADLADLEVVVL